MVPFYQEVSLANQTHGGRLDSADRQEGRSIQDGEVSGQVIPDHGVRHASGIGRPACGLIALIIMQMSHGIPHGIWRRVQRIQPVGLPFVVEPSQDLINEELFRSRPISLSRCSGGESLCFSSGGFTFICQSSK